MWQSIEVLPWRDSLTGSGAIRQIAEAGIVGRSSGRSSGRSRSSDERVAREAAESLFLHKRTPYPFRVESVDGFDYAVEDSGQPETDRQTAETLHRLNSFAIAVIAHLGRIIAGAVGGASAAGEVSSSEAVAVGRAIGRDLGVDVGWLQVMYDRLRTRYSVDDMYEAVTRDPDDTSYVINNGEEIHMCVRSGDSKAVLLTVMTHELAHIASATPDHDDEFWTNYSVLQRVVARMGIVRASDVPADGAVHCRKISIGAREMLSLAADYSDSDSYAGDAGDAGDADDGREELESWQPSPEDVSSPSSATLYSPLESHFVSRSSLGQVSDRHQPQQHPSSEWQQFDREAPSGYGGVMDKPTAPPIVYRGEYMTRRFAIERGESLHDPLMLSQL